MSVGLFFSLGHSTIVFLLSLVVAMVSVALRGRFAALAGIGGILGTGVSAVFLLVIAAANFLILISVYRTLKTARQGGADAEEDLHRLLAKRGFLGRIFRFLFRLVDHSWQMYLIGFLFGLGFDTATEVAVLGISAKEATQGLSIWSILVFPALFTAGMALIDTTDGIVMLGAYHWALVKPLRKLYYNLTMTFISVLVAVLVGTIEVLGLVRDRLRLRGEMWRMIGAMNQHFGMIGFIIIGTLAAIWLASIALSRRRGYGKIEARLS